MAAGQGISPQHSEDDFFTPELMILAGSCRIYVSGSFQTATLEKVMQVIANAEGTGFSRVIVCCGCVDLRKRIPGLTAYIRSNYGLNTTEKGTLFLFCGNRADRIKDILFELL